MPHLLPILVFFSLSALALSASNPPTGIPIPPEIRAELEEGVAELRETIEELRLMTVSDARIRELLPDIVIYYNAVHYALEHDQFYRKDDPNDFEIAATFLRQGMERAAALKKGQAPWARQTGLVVRGYVSDIDDSVQPYGLEIPDDYDFASKESGRLDIWYHGRNNQLSELRFLHDRETKPGKFHSKGTIVLHPFGRYCNANKFAGEVDTFETIEAVSNHYPVDPDRISVRGFSMGGAATWHMATHHAGRWAAAAPGAGFAETAVYANVMSKDPLPAWYERKLFQLYDATKYAANLFHCPTIAYSGSEDKQKQAADIMETYLQREGLDLVHIIGAGMGHKYDDASIHAINDQMDAWLSQPKDQFPQTIHFTTRTLRYSSIHWVTVDALDEHWKRSDISAEIVDDRSIRLDTDNIRGFSIDFPSKFNPFSRAGHPSVNIDGQRIDLPKSAISGTVAFSFRKQDEQWRLVTGELSARPLEKRPGLQGPIDDAFMSRFLFVLPTGKSRSSEFDRWVKSESKDAILQWWRQFRGEARVKLDNEITAKDIAESNLVLWGDPESNQILSRILNGLPIEWNDQHFALDGERHHQKDAVPALIYPNPLNPNRYVVLNSSFTFSAFSGGSNSLQVPKLPDWGVINISVSRNERHPKGIIDAGFFNEFWQFKANPE